MKRIVISLLLFSLTYGERIPVTVERCDEELIVSDGTERFAITLFDVYDYEMADVCAIVMEADSVGIEWETDVSAEQPYASWLFADGELVQALLVSQQKAKVSRYNPTYAYIDELREATDVTPVQAPLRSNHSDASPVSQRIWWVVGAGTLISLGCWWGARRLSE